MKLKRRPEKKTNRNEKSRRFSTMSKLTEASKTLRSRGIKFRVSRRRIYVGAKNALDLDNVIDQVEAKI